MAESGPSGATDFRYLSVRFRVLTFSIFACRASKYETTWLVTGSSVAFSRHRLSAVTSYYAIRANARKPGSGRATRRVQEMTPEVGQLQMSFVV